MIQIAIDGPSGAGKSSLARRLAGELGFLYVDTGALYRAIGLYMMRAGVEMTDPAQVLPQLKKLQLELRYIDGAQHVFLNGEDVSQAIREPRASMAASDVSAIPGVRAFLLDLQRDLARKNSVIMDGRDIGTVVLPGAQLKIFLTASAEERAGRRVAQLEESGHPADYDSILRDIQQRDYQDSHRETAPLKPAEDSVLLDTTGEDFSQSLGRLVSLVRERL